MAEPSVAPGDHRFDGLSGEGSDLGRLLSLSDGVFAFAMTLLVVNLVLPTVATGANAGGIGSYLGKFLPSLGGYVLSFFVIASWWIQHHRLFAAIRRYDERLVRLNSVFLLGISITPFLLALLFAYPPQTLLDTAISAKIAVGLYAVGQLGTGVVYYVMWRHATDDRRLVDRDLPEEWVQYMDRHAEGRILIMLASLAAAAILPVAGEVLWIGVIVNRRRVRPPPRPPPLPAAT